jgi:hypothetical protein
MALALVSFTLELEGVPVEAFSIPISPLLAPQPLLKPSTAKFVLAYCKPDFAGEQELLFDNTPFVSDMGSITRNDAQKYLI